MHSIKDIRDNFDNFKKNLLKRNVQVNFDEIINLDKKNRELINIKETLEKEKKDISKAQDKSLFEKSKSLSLKIEEISKEQIFIKNKLDDHLSELPNIPMEDVPVG